MWLRFQPGNRFGCVWLWQHQVQRLAEKYQHEREQGGLERKVLVDQLARRDAEVDAANEKVRVPLLFSLFMREWQHCGV